MKRKRFQKSWLVGICSAVYGLLVLPSLPMRPPTSLLSKKSDPMWSLLEADNLISQT